MGDLDDLFVLHVTDLDLADALGKPEVLELGERLDGVDFAVLVRDPGLHSSIVMQTLKPKLMPLAPGISRSVADAVISSSSSSKRWSAA